MNQRKKNKIGIDANEGFRQKVVGIGVYTRHLVQELSKIATEEELIFLGIKANGVDTSFVKPGSLRLLWSPGYRSVWSQIRLPVHLLNHKYDVLHVLDHKLPRFCPGRTIVTIYDLAFFKFPETARKAHLTRFAWFTRDAIQRATHLITISESTKRDICEMYGVASSKVDVIYLGVDHSLFKPETLRAKRNSRYILSVGTLQPRKNYSMLIRAFNRLCGTISERVELLIVGKRGWLWEDIEREAKTSPYADRVHLLGYVPDEQMPGLYAGAAMVVMPSLYEGFGIPLLEAMACGAPVIGSNTSSLPEVLGDAGILLDPRDEQSWAIAMKDLLNDNSKQETLRQRGLVRAKEFSWERTAKETFAVYRKVLTSPFQQTKEYLSIQ